MGVLAQAVFQSAYAALSAAMSTTARQRTHAAYLAGGCGLGILVYAILVTVAWIATDPIVKALAERDGSSRRRGKKDRETQSEVDALYETSISTTIPQTLTLSAGLAATALAAATSTASTFVSISSAALPLYISLGVAVAITTAYNATYGYVIPFVQDTLQCSFYKVIHHVIHPVVYFVVLAYQTLYGGALYILSLLQFFPPTGLGWLRYVFAVALPSISEIFGAIGTAFFELVYGLAYFVISNPLFSEPPLYGFFKATLKLGPILRRRLLIPLCGALDVLVGGLIQSLESDNLALFFDYGTRFLWKLPMETAVVPLVTLTRPEIRQTYERQTNATNAAGRYVQEALITILAEWTTERLPYIVNGTDPMPTDASQYLVRFLRSRWAESFTELVNAFTGLIFDVLDAVFHADIVVTYEGLRYWSLPRFERHLIQCIRNLGTIIDTLPSCDNAFATGVKFGDIVALLEALYYLWASARDVAVGEVYETIFRGNPFGFYLALFLQFQSSSLSNYESALNRGTRSVSCIFGFIDKYLATALDSTGTTVFFYLPRIPLELIAYIRYVLQTRQVNILDGVHIDELEARLRDIAGIGQIFFQFEQGANEATCAQRPTFFCSLGLAVKNLILALFQVVIVGARGIVNIVKTFLNLVFFQSVSTFVAPELSGLVAAVDELGCRAGVVVATFFPFNFPCTMSRQNFCKTRQFPNVDNALGPCLATTACTIGRVLVSPVRLVVRIFNIITSFRQVSDSTLAFINVVFDFVIMDLLPPLCPVAHTADCALSAFIPGLQNQSPTTDFICVSLAILISVLRSVKTLIIDFTKLIFRVFGFFVNPNLEGNPVTTFFSLIFEAFRIITVNLFDVIKRLFGYILYVFVVIIYGLCKFVNLFTDDAAMDAPIDPNNPRPCDGIRELLAGLGTAGFNFPTDPDNYKKRQAWEKMNQVGSERCYAVPFARTLFRFMYPDLSQTFENVTTCPDAESVEETASRRIYQVMGEGPRTSEERVRYLYERVAWTPQTRCARIIFAYRNTVWSQVPPESQVTIMECAERVMTIASIQGVFNTSASWLPLDVLYNDMRKYMMAGHAVQFALATMQWTMDRAQPIRTLINDTYIQQWSSLGLYTAHYTRWNALYPGPQAASYMLSPLISSIRARTLMQHLRESFPAVFDPASSNAPTLDQLMDALYQSTSDLLAGSAREQFERAQAIVNANESSILLDAFENETSYVRDRYGSSADTEFRERLASAAFYEALAKGYMAIYQGVEQMTDLWSTEQTNFKRSVEGLSRVARIAWRDDLETADPDVHASWTRAKRDMSESTLKRTQDIHAATLLPVQNEEDRMKRRFAQTVAGFSKAVMANYAHQDHADQLCPESHRGESCTTWLKERAAEEMGFSNIQSQQTSLKKRSSSSPPWERETDSSSSLNATATAWDFFATMFKARTPYTQSRIAQWNSGWASAGNLIWNTYYTLFGDETLSMQARSQRVASRTAPTFDETLAKARKASTAQPDNVNRAYDEWKRQRTSSSSSSKKQGEELFSSVFSKQGWSTMLGETRVDPRTGHLVPDSSALEKGSFTYYRDLFSQNVLEALDAEADRRAIESAAQNSRSHHGKPFAYSPRSATVRSQYLMHSAERDNTEAEPLWIVSTGPASHRVIVPRTSRPPGLKASDYVEYLTAPNASRLHSSFIFDSDEVLVLECVSNFTGLCEFCYLADVAVGIVINRALFTYYYYTTDYVSFLGQTIPFIAYTFDVAPSTNVSNVNLTIVRSGNLTNGPWWFDRHEPIGTYFQLSPNEVAEGLDPGRWIRVALHGAPLPTFARGPLYAEIKTYIETPGGRSRVLYDILWLLETTLGIPIITFVDTIQTYFTTTGGDLVSWIFSKVESCAYTPPQQIYSWSGGLLVTLLYFIVATLLSSLIANLVYPGITVVVVGLALTLFIPLHITITYQGWNIFCVLPPPRYVWDAWRFWAYTLINKCNGWIGLYITNDDYDADTCASCSNVPRWNVTDCEANGFVTVWDSLGYIETWLGGSYVEDLKSAYQTLYSLTIFLDADVSTSRDWTQLEPVWNSRRSAYRNYGVCAVQTVVPYALATLLVGVVAGVFVIALIPNLPALIFSALALVMQIVAMTTFMMTDMERRLSQLAAL